MKWDPKIIDVPPGTASDDEMNTQKMAVNIVKSHAKKNAILNQRRVQGMTSVAGNLATLVTHLGKLKTGSSTGGDEADGLIASVQGRLNIARSEVIRIKNLLEAKED